MTKLLINRPLTDEILKSDKEEVIICASINLKEQSVHN